MVGTGSKLITAEDTEMPRSRSTAIQSERTRRAPSPRPPAGSPRQTAAIFSVSVVLPASGCEVIAKVPLAAGLVGHGAHRFR